MSFVAAKIQQNCTVTGNYNSKATRQGIICGYGSTQDVIDGPRCIFISQDIYKPFNWIVPKKHNSMKNKKATSEIISPQSKAMHISFTEMCEVWHFEMFLTKSLTLLTLKVRIDLQILLFLPTNSTVKLTLLKLDFIRTCSMFLMWQFSCIF